MKVSFKLLAIALVVGLFSACINDDDGTAVPEPIPVQRGNIEANRFIISFTPKSGGGATQDFEFYDLDGIGGNAPLKSDKWLLNSGFSGGILNYDAYIRFYLDSLEVTDQIEAMGTNYIVCFREMNTANMALNEYFNRDVNDKKLGTETSWRVIQKGTGSVKITLNYLSLSKEGLCDAGVRIFEARINYENQ